MGAVKYYDSQGRPSQVPEMRSQVWVEGRDDVGEVVDPGKDFGRVYCVAVHFPSTGEVVYYDRTRVRPASA